MNPKGKVLSKVHYDQIDALKGIAIFLVVLGHSIIFYPIDLHQNSICDFIFRWISSVHMPLFFMVSGFCFSYKEKYKTFIWKKMKRIMLPYFIFNLLDMVPRYLFTNLVNRPSGITESIKKIIFNGGEYWFLYTLFIIFLIYPFLYKWIKNNITASIVTLTIVAIFHFLCPSIELFLLSRVIFYLFYFMIGSTLKETLGKKIFDVKLDKFKTIAIIVSLWVVWIILIKWDNVYLSIPIALIGIFIFYICMQYNVIVKIFNRFGKYSLQLYLLNGFLLVISRTIIVSILGVTNPFLIILFNMFVDFYISYIFIKYICEKIKIAKHLMGML